MLRHNITKERKIQRRAADMDFMHTFLQEAVKRMDYPGGHGF